ncbi:MAG: triacylglycerol lipase [Acidobacteriota bacterium]|jgi:triacylglycerol lipase|nr:triacylglycerol lipase [Acidobacteriota bacterium]
MPAQKTYPIALAHGIARFDFLNDAIERESRKLFGDVFDRILLHLANQGLSVVADGLHYFRGIESFLEADGFDVQATFVRFANSVADRSADLRAEVNRILQETKSPKIHIIAHSMGGLDARAMIARLGMAERVASLTTIGTPHHGTSFADFKLTHGGSDLINLVGKAIDLNGFNDLTRDACQKFNDAVRDSEAANGVFYQTYASSEDREAVFVFLQMAWDIIKKEEQDDNDGLVSLKSQAWQPEIVSADGKHKKQIVQKKFTVAADHLNEVGWWDLNELHGMNVFKAPGARERYETKIREIYRDIARDLRTRFPV